MKVSFCTNVFEKEEIEEAIMRLSKLGYDGVELWDQYLKVADIEELNKLLKDASLSVAQLCPYFDFTGTKERCEESLKQVDRYMDYAEIFDAKLIRVFTGKAGSSEAAEPVWHQAIKGLRQMCLKGKDKGISFALETHPGSLMDTMASTQRLLREVDCSNFGVNLQVPLGNEDVYQTAEVLGKYVIHIHAHNWIGGAPAGNWNELTFLDSGDLDFPKFLDILHKKGFNGYISIEHARHRGTRDPLDVAEHEVIYLKKLIEKYE